MRQHLLGRPQVFQAGSHRIAEATVCSSKRQRLSSVAPKHWSQPTLFQADSHIAWSLGQEDVRKKAYCWNVLQVTRTFFPSWSSFKFQKWTQEFQLPCRRGCVGVHSAILFKGTKCEVSAILGNCCQATHLHTCTNASTYEFTKIPGKQNPRSFKHKVCENYFFSVNQKKLNMVKMTMHMSIIPGETYV